MPFTQDFSVSQSALSPSLVTLNDTSVGSDAAITQRRVYFQTTDGQYLVQAVTSTDYEVWSWADSSATFDILNTDQALAITVQWLDVSNNVLYTLTQVYCLPQNNKQFFYYLIQLEGLSPEIPNDNLYFKNMGIYWMNIVGAINAVEIGADIAASQNCLNRATYMMRNSTTFFGSLPQ